MGLGSKEEKIIKGLASVVGLNPDETGAYDVLKTVAETLGCSVADDGTTAVIEEEVEPQRKRRRGGAAAAAEAEDGEDGEDDEEVEEEEEEEDEEGGSGSEEEGEGEEGEEMEDFDLTMEPVKVEDPRTPDMVVDQASIDDGEALFQWLISPVDVETFYEAIHDDEPLLVTRPNNRGYFGGLFSKDEIDKLLRGGRMQYMYNVDVTSYAGKKRTNYNHNGEEEPEEGAEPEMADADVVWKRFKEGCSVRMLHPQRFCDPLWHLIARLESFLQCPVGCNAYLTPASTQGFAPHWDDIDAFVMQVEGSKRWRLYAPTDPEHVLPRYSSRDFTEEELGECVLDVVLQPGDLLYLPRGVVHQAESQPDSHSLHLTMSANQQRSWAVFLEEALPQALRLAAQQNRDLRRTLPRDYTDYMGVMHAKDPEIGSDEEEDEEGKEEQEGMDARRAEFTQHCAELIEAVMHHMPLDEVADQLAVQFLQQRLPPPRQGAAQPAAEGEAGGSGKLSKGAFVQLSQPGIARLVIDQEGPEPIAQVHHCLANRRGLHAKKKEAAEGSDELDEELAEVAAENAGVIEFPIECAEVLDILLTAGSGTEGSPEAVLVSELPEPEGDCGVSAEAVAQALLDAGVLAVKA